MGLGARYFPVGACGQEKIRRCYCRFESHFEKSLKTKCFGNELILRRFQKSVGLWKFGIFIRGWEGKDSELFGQRSLDDEISYLKVDIHVSKNKQFLRR